MDEEEYLNSLNEGSIYKNDIRMANSYKIQEFTPKSLLDRFGVMTITSMTGTGKTVFLVDCLSKIHKNFGRILLFSKTARLQKVYDFIPKDQVYDQFEEEVITSLWNSQKEMKMNGIDLEPTLIIFDDLIHDPNYKKSKILDDIATGGRHLSISMWIITQNFTSIKPLIRRNTSWAVAFNMDEFNERKKFSETYLSAKNNRVALMLFKRIVKEKKYQMVVVEVHKATSELEEKVKKYIANPSVKPFKIKHNPFSSAQQALISKDGEEPKISRKQKVTKVSLKLSMS